MHTSTGIKSDTNKARIWVIIVFVPVNDGFKPLREGSTTARGQQLLKRDFATMEVAKYLFPSPTLWVPRHIFYILESNSSMTICVGKGRWFLVIDPCHHVFEMQEAVTQISTTIWTEINLPILVRTKLLVLSTPPNSRGKSWRIRARMNRGLHRMRMLLIDPIEHWKRQHFVVTGSSWVAGGKTLSDMVEMDNGDQKR